VITVRSVMNEERLWHPESEFKVVKCSTYRGGPDGFGDIVFIVYDTIRDGHMQRRWVVRQDGGGGSGGILDSRDVE